MLFLFPLAFAVTEIPVQREVDRAFELILRTNIGKSICRDILGSDAQALELHLGISAESAVKIAPECVDSEASGWIYPTAPADIRKISIKSSKPRRYRMVRAYQNFPIESWTDSFSNVTTISIGEKPLNFSRLVQILAHETAVYFDSKSNPLHPGAQEVPHLRGLNFRRAGELDPLLAVSNPMQAHTLTYLRALQVEFEILRELEGHIEMPTDFKDPYLSYLISERCQQNCIEELIVNTRAIYMPFSLPLLAFSPHYREMFWQELPRLVPPWTTEQWQRASAALNHLPVEFLKNQFTGDVVADFTRFFIKNRGQASVDKFLASDLWPAEQRSLANSRFASGETLLEFMKKPLLSGYNISLSSGPRVRVRTGNIE